MTDALVTTDWLANHLHDANLRILDLRYYFDDLEKGQRVYREAHVPGALYLNWTRDISEPRGALQWMAPSAELLERSMRRFGISDDTLIVGYDDEGGHYASDPPSWTPEKV